MPDTPASALDELARDARSIGDIESAAIFVTEPASNALRLAAAAGIEGPALDGLVAAVRDPAHPVARALEDVGPTFDVLPTGPGGPRLRSHVPLRVRVDGADETVGVLAVAHDSPLGAPARTQLVALAASAARELAR